MNERKLYLTTATVVDLVWASSPEAASITLTRKINRPLGDDVDVVDASAVVSEPVESYGWAGE